MAMCTEASQWRSGEVLEGRGVSLRLKQHEGLQFELGHFVTPSGFGLLRILPDALEFVLKGWWGL